MPSNNDYFLSCFQEILNLSRSKSSLEKKWEVRLSHSSICWKCMSLATTKNQRLPRHFLTEAFRHSVYKGSCMSQPLREVILHSEGEEHMSQRTFSYWGTRLSSSTMRSNSSRSPISWVQVACTRELAYD